MKRVAIVGGGISGLAAAYEFARQQRAGARVEFQLFEATDRLGGIVETERRDGFVIECGPDSWVTEKPWARELAIELGLESELIFSEDRARKTYIAEGNRLQAMPDGMRMMVPVDFASLLDSPLFSERAKQNYLREPERAEELKLAALDARGPECDEPVRNFVIRHFGVEVADTVAAPLLAGVFGGDIARLSARAVLPVYVALEREYGSVILGLQQRQRSGVAAEPVFTTLRTGVGRLIEAMETHIPAENIGRTSAVKSVEQSGERWLLRTASSLGVSEQFDAILIAAPAKAAAQLLAPLDASVPELLPQRSSSAVVVAMAYSVGQTASLDIPRGFGFLVPQRGDVEQIDSKSPDTLAQGALLACTFVDQKFSFRIPSGAVLLRAFFGGDAAPGLLTEEDSTLSEMARKAVGSVLGELPRPAFTMVRRWPDSLPLYEVGHLARIAELEARVAQFPHLRLIGNAYRGVGLPDLISNGRNAAREMITALS